MVDFLSLLRFLRLKASVVLSAMVKMKRTKQMRKELREKATLTSPTNAEQNATGFDFPSHQRFAADGGCG